MYFKNNLFVKLILVGGLSCAPHACTWGYVEISPEELSKLRACVVQLDETKIQLNTYKAQIAEKDKIINGATAKFDALSADYKKSQLLLDTVNADCKKSLTLLDAATKDKTDLATRLKKEEEKSRHFETLFENTMATHKSASETLLAKLHAKEAECTALQQENTRIINIAEDITKTLKRLEDNNEALLQQNKFNVDKSAHYEKELKKAQQDIRSNALSKLKEVPCTVSVYATQSPSLSKAAAASSSINIVKLASENSPAKVNIIDAVSVYPSAYKKNPKSPKENEVDIGELDFEIIK